MENIEQYLANVFCIDVKWMNSLLDEELKNMMGPYAGLREIHEFRFIKLHGSDQMQNICSLVFSFGFFFFLRKIGRIRIDFGPFLRWM